MSEIEIADAPGPLPARATVWALAWPAIVGNLLNSTVGFVDLKIVGALGAPAVAAVTTGNRVFFMAQAVLIAVSAGTTALVARAWGARDGAEAERVLRASLVLGVVLGLTLTLLGVALARPIASIFRLDAGVVELAASFVRGLSLFHLPFAVGFVLAVSLRAAGDTRTPLWVGILANVVNVPLAYGLVYGRFGLPELGVVGAAIASGLAFTLFAVVLGGRWLSGGLVLGTGSPGALTRARLGQLVRIGLPAALEQVAWQAGFVLFLAIVALYGTDAYAAYGIGVSLLSFSFVVGFGFSIAASTLVGQHLGAGDPDGAERSGWRAMTLAVAVMVVFGAGIVAGAEPLARFLIDDPAVVHLTVAFIWVLGSVQALMAIEFTLGGALRGAGDTRFPLVVVLCGLFGGRIALAALFAWWGLPVVWVYGALIADYVLKATLLVVRFRGGRWKTAIASA